ncbi:unnamed protein product [Echinostoma caproni]|uniref:Reverse transcriptase domain-containing protein n=1 Tax=Echinostoma caproni TaxID=27848 RepID=A0A183BB94_9TREM|nr:unnamed protein product [Echinostoma caproni]
MTNLLLSRQYWSGGKDEGYGTDFSKAIDKVAHYKVLTKLWALGITGSALRWLEDFLKGIPFSVRVSQAQSAWYTVTSGVPQGSVLGPLLFPIFADDIPSTLSSPFSIYADELKLWRTIQTVADQLSLQDDLNALMN